MRIISSVGVCSRETSVLVLSPTSWPIPVLGIRDSQLLERGSGQHCGLQVGSVSTLQAVSGTILLCLRQVFLVLSGEMSSSWLLPLGSFGGCHTGQAFPEPVFGFTSLWVHIFPDLWTFP
ncbi:unnamed protein product [Schistosoma bovis]|nr:unnamed protein product [Schistosoma bovis]